MMRTPIQGQQTYSMQQRLQNRMHYNVLHTPLHHICETAISLVPCIEVSHTGSQLGLEGPMSAQTQNQLSSGLVWECRLTAADSGASNHAAQQDTRPAHKRHWVQAKQLPQVLHDMLCKHIRYTLCILWYRRIRRAAPCVINLSDIMNNRHIWNLADLLLTLTCMTLCRRSSFSPSASCCRKYLAVGSVTVP